MLCITKQDSFDNTTRISVISHPQILTAILSDLHVPYQQSGTTTIDTTATDKYNGDSVKHAKGTGVYDPAVDVHDVESDNEGTFSCDGCRCMLQDEPGSTWYRCT